MFELSDRADGGKVTDEPWPVEDLSQPVHYEQELLPWLIARDPKRALGLGLGSPLFTRCLLPFVLGLPFLDRSGASTGSQARSKDAKGSSLNGGCKWPAPRTVTRAQWNAFLNIWGPESALAAKLEASFVCEGFGNDPVLLPCYFGRTQYDECERALKDAAARAVAEERDRVDSHEGVDDGKGTSSGSTGDNKERDWQRKRKRERLCAAARGHFLVRESISQPGCLVIAYTNARVSRSSGQIKVRLSKSLVRNAHALGLIVSSAVESQTIG